MIVQACIVDYSFISFLTVKSHLLLDVDKSETGKDNNGKDYDSSYKTGYEIAGYKADESDKEKRGGIIDKLATDSHKLQWLL